MMKRKIVLLIALIAVLVAAGAWLGQVDWMAVHKHIAGE